MSYVGTLFILSAPSGAGKTSLVRALIQSMNDIQVSVSHTTRPMRPGEVNGVDYHFVDDAAFSALQQNGAFLESADVFGHRYATKAGVEQQINLGTDVILEIDWQGAQGVRKVMPKTADIFILPPSKDALRMRLNQRASDTEAVISQRLAKARTEMIHYDEYDFILVNDEFTTTLADLQAIVRSRRLRLKQQQQKHKALLNHLLKP
jgi:guanylate kinase